jgi:hypothetical protein
VGVSAAWKLKNIVFLNFTTNGRLSEKSTRIVGWYSVDFSNIYGYILVKLRPLTYHKRQPSWHRFFWRLPASGFTSPELMVPSVNVFNVMKMVLNERASWCSIVESYGSSLIWPTVVS